jgi:enoyl-CoA hydratase
MEPNANADDLVLRRDEGPVTLLTLNRPKALNALNQPLLMRLAERLREIAGDPSVRVVVLTGAGEKSFVAGADIAEMADYDATTAQHFALVGQNIFNHIGSLGRPVIAAVNGFALGGGLELVLACDFAIASPRAKFGLPEVTLGVIPGFGGTQRLSRLIGRHNALRWILTGDVHSADEALRLGLVTQLVEPEQLLATTLEVAQRIATRGPLALAAARQVVDQGWDLPLADGLRKEAGAFGKLFRSADQKEGMTAFMAKRPAKFLGK